MVTLNSTRDKPFPVVNNGFSPLNRPSWSTAKPVPCEDCGTLLADDWWKSGPRARVCRRCQNKRYEAKSKGTPEGERRRKRKTLLAKLKRIEDRMERDQRTHAEVTEELKSLNNS